MREVIELRTLDDISTCSDTDALLDGLKQCAVNILENISRMAAILRRLDNLGVEVTIDHALIPYVRMIARGELTSECFVSCVENPVLLEKAITLPRGLQEKFAKNEPFELLTPDGGKKTVPALEMTRRDLTQAFNGKVLRSEDEQKHWLNGSANRSEAHKHQHARTARPAAEVPLSLSTDCLDGIPRDSAASLRGMSAQDARDVANLVMVHLYRGNIGAARDTLEDGWQSHRTQRGQV